MNTACEHILRNVEVIVSQCYGRRCKGALCYNKSGETNITNVKICYINLGFQKVGCVRVAERPSNQDESRLMGDQCHTLQSAPSVRLLCLPHICFPTLVAASSPLASPPIALRMYDFNISQKVPTGAVDRPRISRRAMWAPTNFKAGAMGAHKFQGGSPWALIFDDFSRSRFLCRSV